MSKFNKLSRTEMKNVTGGLVGPSPEEPGDPTCRHWYIQGGYKIYSSVEYKSSAMSNADALVGTYGQSNVGWCCASCPSSI